MSITADELAVLAAKRVKLPPSFRLGIQTMIAAALQNLATRYALDPNKRPYLMTDAATTRVKVVPTNMAVDAFQVPVGLSQTGIADLTTLITDNGIMLDMLKYGTVFLQYRVPWHSGNVTLGQWTSGYIAIADAYELTDPSIPFTAETEGTLPTGVELHSTYYPISDITLGRYALAISATEAAADNSITLYGAGTGISTLVSANKMIVQWLANPSQGDLSLCMPFAQLTGWLQGDIMHVKGFPIGADYTYLTFNVPYIPTLDSIPANDAVKEDLVDELVAVIMTGDPAIDEDAPAK